MMNRLAMVLLALGALGLSGCGEGADVLAAGKGMVKIVTTPGDAKIFINGKRKGNSPSEPGQTFAIKLPEGEYTISARKADGEEHVYYAERKGVFVAEDTLQTITLKLKHSETAIGKKRREAQELKANLAKQEKKRQEKLAQAERDRKKRMMQEERERQEALAREKREGRKILAKKEKERKAKLARQELTRKNKLTKGEKINELVQSNISLLGTWCMYSFNKNGGAFKRPKKTAKPWKYTKNGFFEPGRRSSLFKITRCGKNMLECSTQNVNSKRSAKCNHSLDLTFGRTMIRDCNVVGRKSFKVRQKYRRCN